MGKKSILVFHSGVRLLLLHKIAYERIAKPLLFRHSPQRAHEDAMRLLSWCDHWSLACKMLGLMRRASLADRPVEVGGAYLPSPLILAAGFVKGHGFSSEEA